VNTVKRPNGRRDYQEELLTRRSDTSLRQCCSAQNNGHDKSNFITNFTYRVYNKHPSGQSLVYSHRLHYRPTARADHPLGLAAQSKGSGPPTSGWSRPQASTAHLRQWTSLPTLWPTYLTRAGRGELPSRRGCCRRSLSTTGQVDQLEGRLPPVDQPPWDTPSPVWTGRPEDSGRAPC